jgi:hypothetical protein
MTLDTQSKTDVMEQDGPYMEEVSIIMSTLPKILTVDEMDRLEPHIQAIERTAHELISSTDPERLTRRNPTAIAAAAVFEAHHHYRVVTRVKIPIDRMTLVSGVTMSTFSYTWRSLFKRTVDLSRGLLDRMVVDESMDLAERIHAAIVQLRKGVKRSTPAITGWFTRVENEAVELAQETSVPNDVYPDAAALAIIYEASARLLGPCRVRITFKDAREVCGFSETLVSYTRKTLFPSNGGKRLND